MSSRRFQQPLSARLWTNRGRPTSSKGSAIECFLKTNIPCGYYDQSRDSESHNLCDYLEKFGPMSRKAFVAQRLVLSIIG